MNNNQNTEPEKKGQKKKICDTIDKKKTSTATTTLTIFKIHVSIRLINRIGSIHASNTQKRCPVSISNSVYFVVSSFLQRFCCYFTFLAFSRLFELLVYEYVVSFFFLFLHFQYACIRFLLCKNPNSFIPISILSKYFFLSHCSCRSVRLLLCFDVFDQFVLPWSTQSHICHSIRFILEFSLCVRFSLLFFRAFHFSSCTFCVHV